MEYGAVVSSAPTLAPSPLHCPPATPTLSVAFALKVTVLETVELAAGAVRVTVGLVVSPPVVTSTFASEVAFVLVQERVDDCPLVMEAGDAVRVQEGGSVAMLTNLNVFGLFLRSALFLAERPFASIPYV